MKTMVAKSWEEFHLLEHDDEIELKMDPTKEKKPLLTRLLPLSSPKLKIAFLWAGSTWNRLSLMKSLLSAMRI